MDRSLLEKKQLAELREIASTLDLRGYQRMKKADLVDLIVGTAAENGNGKGDDTSSGDDASSEKDGDDDRARGDQREDADRQEADRQDDGGDGDGDGAGRNRNKQRRRKNRSGGNQQDLEDAEVREGVLDLLPEGYGFLRTTGYLSGSLDVYVSQSYVRRFNLRRGDRVRGPIRSNNRGNDKFPALARVDAVEGLDVDDHLDDDRPDFAQLDPVFPTERYALDDPEAPRSVRLVDLVAPIGKGTRGLVLSPPRAGKTTILRDLATTIEASDPDVHVMVLLIDERPEEVTDFERAIDGEVISSPFDRPAEDHTAVAELALERARRLVERGRDVVLLLDSVTRLCRAYNLTGQGSGRTLAGGLDASALHPIKRFLGAARNVEDGGSLTIVATALLQTGSMIDEVIVEELAGTATMELWLDRALEAHGVLPPIDVARSGTHREEQLRTDVDGEHVVALRRALAEADRGAALEALAARLEDGTSTADVLKAVATDGL